MSADTIPPNVPEDLHHLAACLSWEDAVNLLCLYEGWSIDRRNTSETRARVLSWVDDMLTLVRSLPYDWAPPPVTEHTIITAMAAYVRTGKMPTAPYQFDGPPV